MPGRYNWSPRNCTREVKFDSFDGPDCICFFLRRYDGTTGRGITTARSAITAPPLLRSPTPYAPPESKQNVYNSSNGLCCMYSVPH